MVKLAFALFDGEPVLPAFAKMGKLACTCYECGRAVIPKCGEKLTDHFAHARSDAEEACSGMGRGLESTVHLFAKKYIAEHFSQIRFVKKCCTCGSQCDGQLEAHWEGREEVPVGSKKVDVGILSNDVLVAIVEVRHTHAVEPEKLEFLLGEVEYDKYFEIGAMDLHNQYLSDTGDIVLCDVRTDNVCGSCRLAENDEKEFKTEEGFAEYNQNLILGLEAEIQEEIRKVRSEAVDMEMEYITKLKGEVDRKMCSIVESRDEQLTLYQRQQVIANNRLEAKKQKMEESRLRIAAMKQRNAREEYEKECREERAKRLAIQKRQEEAMAIFKENGRVVQEWNKKGTVCDICHVFKKPPIMGVALNGTHTAECYECHNAYLRRTYK